MPPDTTGFDDVYILTIPSFQWIKMYPTDGNATGTYPHHSLSCDIIDNAQMIVIGGTFPSLDICDAPTQHGVHNIDLGQQNHKKAVWEIFAANLTNYAVPDVLISAIGGSAGGGATKTAPATGFSNPDMRVLMTRKADIPSRTPTRAIPTATNAPGDDDDNPLSTGAIAGIAVGGAIALLALTATTILLIRRRRRRNHLLHQHSSHHSSQAKPFPSSSSSPPQQEWSPHDGPSSSMTYTPSSPYPHSPFLHHNANGNGYQPVELPAPPPAPTHGMTTWLGPDGVTYELVGAGLEPAAGSSTALNGGSSTVDTGTGAGTTGTAGTAGSGRGNRSGGETTTKIDSDGRLWVQISPGAGPGPGPGGALTTPPGGGGSPLGLSPSLGRYHSHSPLAASPGDSSLEPQRSGDSTNMMEPQELMCEPRGEGGGGYGGAVLRESAGWDAAHGRPRHLTFYHP